MPAKSRAQQHLMAAAAHGATFPLARELRGSMTLGQLNEFASTSTKGLPGHVSGSSPSHKSRHPHKNLGTYLHPKRGR